MEYLTQQNRADCGDGIQQKRRINAEGPRRGHLVVATRGRFAFGQIVGARSQ